MAPPDINSAADHLTPEGSEPFGARPGGVLDIAVVGSGISGLSAAWLLSQRHRVTLYEAEDRLGGHTNTISLPAAGGAGSVAVDTGFIVYNEATYPNLTALFAHLGVETRASDMSFAVSLRDGAREYAGTDLWGLFAQRSNLLRPRFWSMLRDLMRFYREAPADAAGLEAELTSLGDYLDAKGYGQPFQQDHLLPMAAAIWSCSAGRVRDFPAAAFIRFCETHGLLKVSDRPVWRTVVGGSRSYIPALTRSLQGNMRTGRRVVALRRNADDVLLMLEGGDYQRHDHVVLATHAPQTLAMLADPDAREHTLLSAIRTSPNRAVLHTDASLMPRRKKVWASWNYLGEQDQGDAPCVTYWMNQLQGIPGPIQYFVTLNPTREPAPSAVLHTETYTHPLFDAGALRAQKQLWSLQGRRRTWFCGAWFGSGFHEDGLQSGLAVAEELGRVRRPWNVAGESGRIYLPPPLPAMLKAA